MHWLTDGVFHKAETRDPHKPGNPLIYQDSGIPFDIPENATTIEIPEGTVLLGDYAFQGFSRLKKVVLPEGIMKVGNFAFESCKGLREINFPPSLEILGRSAFVSTGFTHIEIPETIKEIHSWCFYSCSKLESFAFPPVDMICVKNWPTIVYRKDLRTCVLLDWSYYGKTVVMPDCLEGCRLLKEIRNINHLDGEALTLRRCFSMEKIEISLNAEILPTYAYGECTSLAEIIIPDKVKQIGYNAFDGCTSLKKVVIPKSIQKVEAKAFNDCPALEHLVIHKAFHGFETAFPDSKNVTRVDIVHSATGTAHAMFPKADIYDLEGELCYSAEQETNVTTQDASKSPIVSGMAFEKLNVPKLKNANWDVLVGNLQINVDFKGAVTLNRSVNSFFVEQLPDEPIYYDAPELAQLNPTLYLTDESTGAQIEALKADESRIFDFHKVYGQPLTHAELKQRAASFAIKVAQCFSPATITRVIDYLPKKKNGTLYRGKRTTILKSKIASAGGDVLVLYAETTNDQSVTFQVKRVYMGRSLYVNPAAEDVLKL